MKRSASDVRYSLKEIILTGRLLPYDSALLEWFFTRAETSSPTRLATVRGIPFDDRFNLDH